LNISQTAIKENRMNISYAFGLAAAIAISQSLHAQSCSGGAGGGMDATGNQCNAPASVAAFAPEPVAVPPVELSGADSSRRVRPLAVRLSKSWLPQFRSTALAIPVSRSTAAVIVPPTTVENGGTFKSTCSGGADGGMDATGNQCGE
jgi:hypothetical protein